MARMKYRLALLIAAIRSSYADFRLALTLRPIAGGSPEGDGEGEGGDGGDGDAGKGGSGDGGEGEGDGEGSGEGKGEPDWKTESRKHERRAKSSAKRIKELEDELASKSEADKSEEEKRIEAAKKEAREEALSEAQKDRRADRLEVAVTRIAAKGVEIGEGEDKKTVRFADPEDALVFVERRLARGDISDDDIFDSEHRVQTEALEDELRDLLKSKPRLAADSNGGDAGKGAGSADGGKGAGSGKGLEDLTPEDFDKRMRKGAAGASK